MAKESCDFKIASDMVANCEKASIGGLANNGYIMNFEDVDFEATQKDETNPNLYTSLVLKEGKKAYRIFIPGKAPFTGTTKTMEEGTYMAKFTKSAKIVILDNGPDVVMNVINPLANGRFVLVLENKYSGATGNNTFEIYGLEQGLTAKELVDEKYSEDTDGGWAVTLEEAGARSGGIYLYATSISATRQALETLVSPVG